MIKLDEKSIGAKTDAFLSVKNVLFTDLFMDMSPIGEPVTNLFQLRQVDFSIKGLFPVQQDSGHCP